MTQPASVSNARNTAGRLEPAEANREEWTETSSAPRQGSPAEPLPVTDAALDEAPLPNSGWRRGLFLSCAGFFFVLGALGAFLPGLPATPFLLLTSYFLVRTSPRLNQRLLRSRMFGPILVDWQVHGGVRTDVKVKAIGFVVAAVALTIWLADRSWIVSLAVIALALLGIFVILRLPPTRDV